MKKLNIEEMKKVEGGASVALIGTIVGTVIAFLVGVFNGYANPQKCNN